MEQKQTQKTDAEIDMIPLIQALLKKLWLMVLVGGIVAGIVFTVSKIYIKPVYRCGFSAYVNNRQAQVDKSSLTNSDLIASQHLTKTFSHIICSNSVLSASLKSINSNLKYSQFSGMVSTSIKDETELISVYVVNKDPKLAYDLANAIAETAPKYIADIVDGSSMKIVDYPVYNETSYNPPHKKYLVLGFLVGFAGVAAIFAIRYFKDDTIKDESELESYFSLPVLGVVPDTNKTKKAGYGYYKGYYGYGRYGKSTERSK